MINSALVGILIGWGFGAAVGGTVSIQLLVGCSTALLLSWSLYHGLCAVANRLGTATDQYRIQLQSQPTSQPKPTSADGGQPPTE